MSDLDPPQMYIEGYISADYASVYVEFTHAKTVEEIEAENEHDAAEIELMNEDMDNDPDVADDGVIELAADLEDEKEMEED